MKIAVLGAGAGGTAIAFDCAAHGHDVRLFDFPQFADNIAAVASQKGIYAEGGLAGFANVAYAGHDIDETLRDCELIYVVGPAYSTEPFGAAVAGKLQPGQTVVVTPSSCGGALAVLRLIEDVYPGMEPARSVMQTSLQNANPIIHPAVTLTNAARIEQTGGDFLFYEEGVSDATGRLIEALDRERIAIGRRLGIRVVPDPELAMRQGYMLADDYGEAYRTAPGFLGIGAQPGLDHRYLNEDVGYGLVFFAELGRQVGIETPTIDAVIQVTSVLMARDYAGEAVRTPESLGIGELSAGELARL